MSQQHHLDYAKGVKSGRSTHDESHKNDRHKGKRQQEAINQTKKDISNLAKAAGSAFSRAGRYLYNYATSNNNIADSSIGGWRNTVSAAQIAAAQAAARRREKQFQDTAARAAKQFQDFRNAVGAKTIAPLEKKYGAEPYIDVYSKDKNTLNKVLTPGNILTGQIAKSGTEYMYRNFVSPFVAAEKSQKELKQYYNKMQANYANTAAYRGLEKGQRDMYVWDSSTGTLSRIIFEKTTAGYEFRDSYTYGSDRPAIMPEGTIQVRDMDDYSEKLKGAVRYTYVKGSTQESVFDLDKVKGHKMTKAEYLGAGFTKNTGSGGETKEIAVKGGHSGATHLEYTTAPKYSTKLLTELTVDAQNRAALARTLKKPTAHVNPMKAVAVNLFSGTMAMLSAPQSAAVNAGYYLHYNGKFNLSGLRKAISEGWNTEYDNSFTSRHTTKNSRKALNLPSYYPKNEYMEKGGIRSGLFLDMVTDPLLIAEVGVGIAKGVAKGAVRAGAKQEVRSALTRSKVFRSNELINAELKRSSGGWRTTFSRPAGFTDEQEDILVHRLAEAVMRKTRQPIDVKDVQKVYQEAAKLTPKKINNLLPGTVDTSEKTVKGISNILSESLKKYPQDAVKREQYIQEKFQVLGARLGDTDTADIVAKAANNAVNVLRKRNSKALTSLESISAIQRGIVQADDLFTQVSFAPMTLSVKGIRKAVRMRNSAKISKMIPVASDTLVKDAYVRQKLSDKQMMRAMHAYRDANGHITDIDAFTEGLHRHIAVDTAAETKVPEAVPQQVLKKNDTVVDDRIVQETVKANNTSINIAQYTPIRSAEDYDAVRTDLNHRIQQTERAIQNINTGTDKTDAYFKMLWQEKRRLTKAKASVKRRLRKRISEQLITAEHTPVSAVHDFADSVYESPEFLQLYKPDTRALQKHVNTLWDAAAPRQAQLRGVVFNVLQRNKFKAPEETVLDILKQNIPRNINPKLQKKLLVRYRQIAKQFANTLQHSDTLKKLLRADAYMTASQEKAFRKMLKDNWGSNQPFFDRIIAQMKYDIQNQGKHGYLANLEDIVFEETNHPLYRAAENLSSETITKETNGLLTKAQISHILEHPEEALDALSIAETDRLLELSEMLNNMHEHELADIAWKLAHGELPTRYEEAILDKAALSEVDIPDPLKFPKSNSNAAAQVRFQDNLDELLERMSNESPIEHLGAEENWSLQYTVDQRISEYLKTYDLKAEDILPKMPLERPINFFKDRIKVGNEYRDILYTQAEARKFMGENEVVEGASPVEHIFDKENPEIIACLEVQDLLERYLQEDISPSDLLSALEDIRLDFHQYPVGETPKYWKAFEELKGSVRDLVRAQDEKNIRLMQNTNLYNIKFTNQMQRQNFLASDSGKALAAIARGEEPESQAGRELMEELTAIRQLPRETIEQASPELQNYYQQVNEFMNNLELMQRSGDFFEDLQKQDFDNPEIAELLIDKLLNYKNVSPEAVLEGRAQYSVLKSVENQLYFRNSTESFSMDALRVDLAQGQLREKLIKQGISAERIDRLISSGHNAMVDIGLTEYAIREFDPHLAEYYDALTNQGHTVLIADTETVGSDVNSGMLQIALKEWVVKRDEKMSNFNMAETVYGDSFDLKVNLPEDAVYAGYRPNYGLLQKMYGKGTETELLQKFIADYCNPSEPVHLGSDVATEACNFIGNLKSKKDVYITGWNISNFDEKVLRINTDREMLKGVVFDDALVSRKQKSGLLLSESDAALVDAKTEEFFQLMDFHDIDRLSPGSLQRQMYELKKTYETLLESPAGSDLAKIRSIGEARNMYESFLPNMSDDVRQAGFSKRTRLQVALPNTLEEMMNPTPLTTEVLTRIAEDGGFADDARNITAVTQDTAHPRFPMYQAYYNDYIYCLYTGHTDLIAAGKKLDHEFHLEVQALSGGQSSNIMRVLNAASTDSTESLSLNKVFRKGSEVYFEDFDPLKPHSVTQLMIYRNYSGKFDNSLRIMNKYRFTDEYFLKHADEVREVFDAYADEYPIRLSFEKPSGIQKMAMTQYFLYNKLFHTQEFTDMLESAVRQYHNIAGELSEKEIASLAKYLPHKTLTEYGGMSDYVADVFSDMRLHKQLTEETLEDVSGFQEAFRNILKAKKDNIQLYDFYDALAENPELLDKLMSHQKAASNALYDILPEGSKDIGEQIMQNAREIRKIVSLYASKENVLYTLDKEIEVLEQSTEDFFEHYGDRLDVSGNLNYSAVLQKNAQMLRPLRRFNNTLKDIVRNSSLLESAAEIEYLKDLGNRASGELSHRIVRDCVQDDPVQVLLATGGDMLFVRDEILRFEEGRDFIYALEQNPHISVYTFMDNSDRLCVHARLKASKVETFPGSGQVRVGKKFYSLEDYTLPELSPETILKLYGSENPKLRKELFEVLDNAKYLVREGETLPIFGRMSATDMAGIQAEIYGRASTALDIPPVYNHSSSILSHDGTVPNMEHIRRPYYFFRNLQQGVSNLVQNSDNTLSYINYYIGRRSEANINTLFSGMTDQEILNTINAQSDMVLVVMTEDKVNAKHLDNLVKKYDETNQEKYLYAIRKTGAYQVQIVNCNTVKDVQHAKKLNAAFVPVQVYETMAKNLNYHPMLTAPGRAMQYYMYIMKATYLMKLVTGFRNWMDETLKTFNDIGWENAGLDLKCQFTAVHNFVQYNKVIRHLQKETGKASVSMKEASLRCRRAIAITHADISEDTFRELHGFLLFGASGGGQASIVRQAMLTKHSDTFAGLRGKELFEEGMKKGNQKAYARYMADSMTALPFLPMEYGEKITRYAHFLALEELGVTRTEAFGRVSRTHFNYDLKDRATMYAELFVPFYNFTKLNLDYWGTLFMEQPHLIRNMSEITRRTLPAAVDEANEEDRPDTAQLNYLMSGDIPMGELFGVPTQGVYLKLNPSMFDAVNFLLDPMNQSIARLFTPLQVGLDKVLDIQNAGAGMMFDIGYNNGWKSLIPVYGTYLEPMANSVNYFMERTLRGENQPLYDTALGEVIRSPGRNLPSEFLGLDRTDFSDEGYRDFLMANGYRYDYISGRYKMQEQCEAVTLAEAEDYWDKRGFAFDFAQRRYVPKALVQYQSWSDVRRRMAELQHKDWDYLTKTWQDLDSDTAIFDYQAYAKFMKHNGFAWDYAGRITADGRVAGMWRKKENVICRTWQEAAEYWAHQGREWDYVRWTYVPKGRAIAGSYQQAAKYWAERGLYWDWNLKAYVPKDKLTSSASRYYSGGYYGYRRNHWRYYGRRWHYYSRWNSFEDYADYMAQKGKAWDNIRKRWVDSLDAPSFTEYSEYMLHKGLVWDSISKTWTSPNAALGKTWADYRNWYLQNHTIYDYELGTYLGQFGYKGTIQTQTAQRFRKNYTGYNYRYTTQGNHIYEYIMKHIRPNTMHNLGRSIFNPSAKIRFHYTQSQWHSIPRN